MSNTETVVVKKARKKYKKRIVTGPGNTRLPTGGFSVKCVICGGKVKKDIWWNKQAKTCSKSCAAHLRWQNQWKREGKKPPAERKEIILSEEDSMIAAKHNVNVLKEYSSRLELGESIELILGKDGKYQISAPGNPMNM